MESYKLDYESRPSLIVRFSLTDDNLQPDLLTETLGVLPEKAWSKGDAWKSSDNSRFKPRSTRPTGRWSLIPSCSKYDDLETQLGSLLSILEALPSQLHEYIKLYNGEISIAYSTGENNFGFHFTPSILERLQKLGVAIDFDIYPIYEDESSE
jgi:hypothetical protein